MNHNTAELRAIADLLEAIAERFHDDYNWHCHGHALQDIAEQLRNAAAHIPKDQ